MALILVIMTRDHGRRLFRPCRALPAKNRAAAELALPLSLQISAPAKTAVLGAQARRPGAYNRRSSSVSNPATASAAAAAHDGAAKLPV